MGINDLEKKRDGAGKFGKIFQAMIDRYTKCQVEWQEPNAPIIDPAPPRSIAEQVDDSYANNNDDSYNTKEKIVEVDDSYNTNEKIVEVDDSYNTNEKIVDVTNPVTCASEVKVNPNLSENLKGENPEGPQPY